jgi:RNA recognition motif-containing protein
MAVFWVQHYYTLPVIFEDFGMGDEVPPRPGFISQGNDEHLSRGTWWALCPLSYGILTFAERPVHAPITPSTLPPSQPVNMDFEHYPRQALAMDNFASGGALDLSSMAASLPDFQMRQFQQPPFNQSFQPNAAPNPTMMYQYHQGTQFAGQTAPTPAHTYVQQYAPHFVQNTPSRQQGTAFSPFMGNQGAPQSYQNQAFLMQHSMLQHQQQQSRYQQQFGAPAFGAPYAARTASGYVLPQVRLDSSMAQLQTPSNFTQLNPQREFRTDTIAQNTTNFGALKAVRRSSSNSSLQTSALRGPPRKPKQSGHALWVGNLPPATHIIDLKDHFAKDATEDIESVFLISKSNCAFVNYKTESSCAAAMTRFHDSKFQGVRLVCRLRRGSAAAAAPAPTLVQPAPDTAAEDEEREKTDSEAVVAETAITVEPEPLEKVKEKFFVVKSLTVEDLERSVASGIWATQAHNENALNTAFQVSSAPNPRCHRFTYSCQAAENVYLIFSANKSGEYFGYARMESSIDDESAADVEYQPRTETIEPGPADVPLTIPTPPTATAPKGRIIDDSARGTIFWEADLKDKEKDEQHTDEEAGNLSGEGYESASPGTPQTFGKPFKIKWMSTDRLPFYRTRGLRNPWNANREVKIARDGTEIEPSIGRRLVNMFHRPPGPTTSPGATRQQQMPQGPMVGFMSPHGAAPGGIYGRSY